MIEFKPTDPNSHRCYAEKEGVFAVFRCPICRDYTAKINLITRKMTTTQHPDNPAKHHGAWQSLALDLADKHYHPN
jgi:hypothetical protein